MEKMKIRGRVGSSWWSFGSKLGLPAVFLLCSFFFLAGFFGFMLLSQEGVSGLRPTPRLLELVDEAVEFDPLTHGQTGESSVTSIPFQILSWKPRAVYFPHFATVAQCQIMIKMAKAQLAPSTLALREGETAENTKGIRTSSGMFISAFEDKTGTLDLIEEKIARATMIPKNHGEENIGAVLKSQGRSTFGNSHYSSMLSSYTSDLDLDLPRVDAEFILMMPKLGRLIPELREGFLNIRTADAITRRGYLQNKSRTASVLSHGPSNDQAFNILRYEIGQRYNSHYDAFNPAEYGPQKSQRIASFLLYLSDVEEGGETMFPFENGLPMDLNYDYRKCVGLKIKPRIGDGLLFYSLFPNGTIDATSLHGSCPVITGQKWVATKWIRNQEQDD